MTRTSAQTPFVSVTMAFSGVMSGICACCRSVSVAVVVSVVLFAPVGVDSFGVAIFCPYHADTPSRWGVTVVVRSLMMMELVQNSQVSVKVWSPRMAPLLAYAAATTAGV